MISASSFSSIRGAAACAAAVLGFMFAAPEPVSAQFIWPVSGRLSSVFYSCRDGCSRYHEAIDVAGPTGDTMGAGYAGTASFVGVSCGLSCGYGRLVILNHASSYQTYYAHCDSFIISNGQSVSKNQNVARRGTTGNSTGPHLHYEIRRNGTRLYMPGSVDNYVTRNVGVPYSYPGLDGTLPTYTDDTPAVSSGWAYATGASDKYGPSYYYKSTQAISDPASWTINVGTSGSYRVQAWWSQGSNRSSAAPYILPDGANVKANQQTNGGKWNFLKTVSLGTGNRTTQLSCWAAAGYVVIADAVRYGP